MILNILILIQLLIMHNFEKLKIWQKAMDISVEVYKISILLPNDEKFNLIHQIKKCAVSIPSNIAEGSGRNHNKEFVQPIINQLLEISKMNFSFQKTLITI